MIIPIRCFTCGKVLADKQDYYDNEVQKMKLKKKEEPKTEPLYKNFDDIHTKDILDSLGLTRYCCRRHLISNVDMMKII